MQEMTREERRMIDEAISQGRVKRIPRGVSGECRAKSKRGRKRHINAIRIIRLLAQRGMTDAQIARHVNKTKKAVSNMRYRHHIPAGQPKK